MYEAPYARFLVLAAEDTMSELITASDETDETDNTVSIDDLLEGLL